MAQVHTRVEVGLELLGARQMECIRCGNTDSVAEFGRHITSRGGLGVIYCECPICEAKWRRIDVGTYQ